MGRYTIAQHYLEYSLNETNNQYAYHKTGIAQDFEGTRIEYNPNTTTNKTVHSPIIYKNQDGHHFLIIDLNHNLINRACFKHNIGLKTGIIPDYGNTTTMLIKDHHNCPGNP